jgi:CHASE2 domain-containing sensor protein
MSRLVVLNLGKGNLQEGFPFVTAQLQAQDNLQPRQFTGSLPPNGELIDCYRRWQLLYELLYQVRSLHIRSLEMAIAIDETDVTHVSDADFEDICQELQNRIDSWLDAAEFSPIYRQLQQQLKQEQAIRFIIQTEDERLRKLPWHIWRFFRDYRLAEVALSPLNFEPATTTQNSVKKVRILAILGDSTGINIEADRQLLENLPDAQTVFLVEPDRQTVSEHLWDSQGWDILFFAGHSLTQDNGDTGRIVINAKDSLTVAQLKNALTEAMARGLQLAIFNSCDGLGLARQLSDLHLPLTIVMREPVPDKVAQAFLKYFLAEFADGQLFEVAVRKARERLQGLEGEFPGASWLPVIFQNPAQTAPSWKQLSQKHVKGKPRKSLASIQNLLLGSLACTIAIMGGRAIALYQDWELKAFDSFLQLKSTIQSTSEGPDERILIVEVTQADTDALGGEYPIQDITLLRALQELDRHQPLGVGIDIIRDRPVGQGWNELVQYLKQHWHIVPACSHPEGNDSGIASPLGNKEEQSAFIDYVKDPDGIVRRHLLSLDPPNGSPCSSSLALSTKLTYFYLSSKGYFLEFSPQKTWQFKHLTQKSLEWQILGAFGGFYQQPELTRGHQILLSYRSYNGSLNEIAQRVTLTDVLQGRVDASLIRNRIILIGITDPSLTKDEVATPYNQEIRGLMLHAQMVSQLLSVVEDKRSLLRFLPFWADMLWIWSFALISILVLRRFPSLIGLGIVGVLIPTAYGISFLILLQWGAIIPFVPSVLALAIPAIGATIYIVWQSDRIIYKH